MKYRIFLTMGIFFNMSQAVVVPKPYYLCSSNDGRGFFSYMKSVIGFLDFIEINDARGEVIFNEGLYLSPIHGPNWWNYYFEPIVFGEAENSEIIHCYTAPWAVNVGISMSERRISELYHRYVKLTQDLRLIVDKFIQENFQNSFVIGVHYRGTDKQLSEASVISYDDAIDVILKEINKLNKSNVVCFVATDDQKFLDVAIEKLPNVVCQSGVRRSLFGEPVHLCMVDPYAEGAACVVDFVLLLESDFLIRTSSNLSMLVALINYEKPNILINNSLFGFRNIKSLPEN